VSEPVGDSPVPDVPEATAVVLAPVGDSPDDPEVVTSDVPASVAAGLSVHPGTSTRQRARLRIPGLFMTTPTNVRDAKWVRRQPAARSGVDLRSTLVASGIPPASCRTFR